MVLQFEKTCAKFGASWKYIVCLFCLIDLDEVMKCLPKYFYFYYFFCFVSPGQLSEKEQRDSSRLVWERSWCRKTLRTSPLKMYDANTHPKNHFLNVLFVQYSHVLSSDIVPAHTFLFRSAQSWRCRWCVTYGNLKSTLIMRWSSSWGRWTGPQRFLSMFTWWVMPQIHFNHTFWLHCTISHFWTAHNYRVLNGMHLIWKSYKTPGEFCWHRHLWKRTYL